MPLRLRVLLLSPRHGPGIHENRAHGTSAITAVTAQNTLGVSAWQALPAALVAKQIDALAEDLRPAAIKTGMLGSREIVETVAERIARHRLTTYVLDPVMVATSGDRLLDRDAEKVIARRLAPLALLVTPNLNEAEILVDAEVRTPDQMERAARALVAMGARAALVKGGRRPTEQAARSRRRSPPGSRSVARSSKR